MSEKWTKEVNLVIASSLAKESKKISNARSKGIEVWSETEFLANTKT